MKTLSALLVALVALTAIGCNPDHSGDTRTVPLEKPKTSAVEQNPNVPDAVKKQLSNSIPPASAPTPGQ